MPGVDHISLQDRMLLQYEVEQFFYYESSLLDERRFDEWLNLLTEDMHYWMPIRRTTTLRQTSSEFTKPGAMAFFDDDLNFLKMRIAKMTAGNAWSEDPPSRTRHIVNNVQILSANDEEIETTANFHLYRTRLESEEDSWIGCRKDMLRRVDGSLMLARRHIFLEQTVLLAQNMSNIF